MSQERQVWVAEVPDREALVRLLRAALSHGIAPVNLANTNVTSGVHTLQIRLRGESVVVLAAELAGETATGDYALRLRPLDPSHVPELKMLAGSTESFRPPPGPMSTALDGRFSQTLVDPEPDDIDEDELEASVLFDPEAALISRAPARPDGAGPEDTLTIPFRASMVPPGMDPAKPAPPPRRPPSGPHTISHLSIPSTMPATERRDTMEDIDLSLPTATTESTAAAMSEPYVSTKRQGSTGDSVSVNVDFDTSQTNVNTQRHGLWANDDGASAADASLGGSVVFDPDVLAREQRLDPKDAHPAEAEDYSVVFGTEATRPGDPPSHGQRESRRVGVIVTAQEDLSLTPTMPFEVPPRSSPVSTTQRGAPIPPIETRRGPPIERVDRSDEPVDDDAETYPRQSERPQNSRGAISSGRGPRTQKRSTGPVDVVVPGRIIANRYRIESLVGAGAVGAVYKATHVDLPRTFAIKVLHPHYRTDAQLLASFRTEARAASLLDHPNVTVVHDFGEEPDGLVYIVMEYLPGVNLQTILDEERRLDPRRAIAIMLQVCGALSAAHERGIIHRDVKPDNIMLVPSRDDEGRPYELVKVCDFGIAALETTPDATDPEWTAGTPEYMAPEQAHGRADARTDVYACGIVLYEMITGRPPFVGETPIATLAKHANELARPPSELAPGLSATLERVVGCAMEKAPERRFQTMRELRVELKRLL